MNDKIWNDAVAEGKQDEIHRLRAVAWAAQGLMNADSFVSDVPREQAVREATIKLRQALGTWQMYHTGRALNPVTPADATDVGSPVLTHESGTRIRETE